MEREDQLAKEGAEPVSELSCEEKENKAANTKLKVSSEDEIDSFIEHIDSLATSFPLSRAILSAMLQNSQKEYQGFVDTYCEVDSSGDDELITVGPQYLTKYNKLAKQLTNASIALKTVPRSLLVSWSF